LVRSLEVMFKSMLESDGALEMSPQRYLEKIFQYSLVLPPMSADGFRQLAYHLLPPAETAAPAGAAAETATVEAQAPPERREDPAPRDLVVTDAEREFVTQLWPLFKTPRALKRMTNLYRLIRFSLGEEQVLEDNAYAIILYILGQCVARPDRVHNVFTTLRDREDASMSELRTLPSVEWPGSTPKAADVLRWAPVVTEFTFHPWRN
ncbi:MAG TPA: hypothetical protein VFG79_01710, partial [Solirubrobacter sp.]|nr:hypothetical protein [Solirubrobacter sp.]